MNIKKLTMIFLAAVCFSTGVFAQQITKFGVVDTSKVYQAYFRNSAPVRNYESKKSALQADITKKAEEIRKLKQQKADYEASGNEAQASRIDSEIIKKTAALTEYTNAKNIELETMKSNLQNSDSFYKKLYKTLERVAEDGGYSVILSLQNSNGILWYSNSVDVTDRVIAELGM